MLLPIGVAHSQEALIVHIADGARPISILLDDIQRITFSGDDLSAKLFDGSVAAYALDAVAKLTFGDGMGTGISAPPASDPIDVVVYFASPGEMVVECRGDARNALACNAITRVAVFGIDGTMRTAVGALHATPRQQTTIDISAFPPGVYLLQIETLQGTTVKKIIKK